MMYELKPGVLRSAAELDPSGSGHVPTHRRIRDRAANNADDLTMDGNRTVTKAGDVATGDTILLDDGSMFKITDIREDGDSVELDGYREWDGGNADYIANYACDEHLTHHAR